MNDFISYLKSNRNRQLFFILGAQGSGTNLVCRTLRSIFDFSVIQDRSLIFNAAVEIYKNNTARNVQRVFRRVHSKMFPGTISKKLRLDHYHHRKRFFVGIKEYFPKIQINNAEDFAYFFYNYYAFSENKNFIAIKSDDIWENISYIAQIFQYYRYIFLTRDCRDNVLSIINKNFGPRNIYVGSHYIKQRVKIYHNEILNHPNIALQVSYEELLTDPRNFIEKFSQMSGIQPIGNIDKQLQHLKIRNTNFQKWKTLMSKEELLTCETILRDELNAMGYCTENKTFQEFSNPKIWRERIYDVSFRIPQKISRFYRNFLRD